MRGMKKSCTGYEISEKLKREPLLHPFPSQIHFIPAIRADGVVSSVIVDCLTKGMCVMYTHLVLFGT